MQKYYATVKAGGFGLTCPACGGTFQAEHKKQGIETAIETCPHCKAKIEAKYEPELDSFWDQQKIKTKESGIEQLNLKMMQNLTGEERENFKHGLHILGQVNPEDRAALRDSFRRLHPEYTEEQIEIAVKGR